MPSSKNSIDEKHDTAVGQFHHKVSRKGTLRTMRESLPQLLKKMYSSFLKEILYDSNFEEITDSDELNISCGIYESKNIIVPIHTMESIKSKFWWIDDKSTSIRRTYGKEWPRYCLDGTPDMRFRGPINIPKDKQATFYQPKYFCDILIYNNVSGPIFFTSNMKNIIKLNSKISKINFFLSAIKHNGIKLKIHDIYGSIYSKETISKYVRLESIVNEISKANTLESNQEYNRVIELLLEEKRHIQSELSIISAKKNEDILNIFNLLKDCLNNVDLGDLKNPPPIEKRSQN